MKTLAYSFLRVLVILLAAATPPFLWAADAPSMDMPTPPRLSLVDGSASFWRTGAENWSPAQVNTPLVRGDSLYTGDAANLEIQTGARAFVRAGNNTLLSLVEQTPDFFQFKVASGMVAFDLRTLTAGHSVEVDTPNAVFSIDRPGYYRLDILGDSSHFIIRRGGRAIVTLPDGQSRSLASSEEAVVQGASVETYVAPSLDAWDKWNYARTEHLLDAISQRYVPADVYGADELDAYGSWRVTSAYGPVWVPSGLAPDWAPYSTGSWVWDPFYGWTWVDRAPWGWAPSHYGRWVFINGYWAWAPGPRVVRPAYAPALVAFFRIGNDSFLQLGLNGPGVGWVALGWGEPLMPWWGGSHFRGTPWWGGWGGPHEERHGDYHNTTVRHSVIAVDDDHFGRGRIQGVRVPFDQNTPHVLTPGEPTRSPRPESLSAQHGTAFQPPATLVNKPIFTARPPRETALPWKSDAPQATPPRTETRLIRRAPVPANEEPQSPPFGTRKGPERAQPPLPPPPPRTVTQTRRMTAPAQPAETPSVRESQPALTPPSRTGGRTVNAPTARQETAPPVSTQRLRVPQRETTPATAPRENTIRAVPARQERTATQPAQSRQESARPSPRPIVREKSDLPGQPANRLYPRDLERRGGDNR